MSSCYPPALLGRPFAYNKHTLLSYFLLSHVICAHLRGIWVRFRGNIIIVATTNLTYSNASDRNDNQIIFKNTFRAEKKNSVS
jgi:hypothetical protein